MARGKNEISSLKKRVKDQEDSIQALECENVELRDKVNYLEEQMSDYKDRVTKDALLEASEKAAQRIEDAEQAVRDVQVLAVKYVTDKARQFFQMYAQEEDMIPSVDSATTVETMATTLGEGWEEFYAQQIPDKYLKVSRRELPRLLRRSKMLREFHRQVDAKQPEVGE